MKNLRLHTYFLLSTALFSCTFTSQLLAYESKKIDSSHLDNSIHTNATLKCRRPKLIKVTTPAATTATPVFASFRSDFSGLLETGASFPFTIEEINYGDGIELDNNGTEFIVNKSGAYMISYGCSTQDSDQVGFSLMLIRDGATQEKGAILLSTSEVVALNLQQGDRLKLNAQYEVAISTTAISTSHLDTAYITFMQIQSN